MMNDDVILPIEIDFEFFLDCVALLIPDKTAFACSLPNILKLRESFICFNIRFDRERGTLVKIKCFILIADGESPISTNDNKIKF